jgi:hypothetical protein
MKTHASLELEACCYKLVPVSRSTAREILRGSGLSPDERHTLEDIIMEGVLYQTDLDWPSLAKDLGWDGAVPEGLNEVPAAGDWLGDRIDNVFMVDTKLFENLIGTET